jgi:hypothetical protein
MQEIAKNVGKDIEIFGWMLYYDKVYVL